MSFNLRSNMINALRTVLASIALTLAMTLPNPLVHSVGVAQANSAPDRPNLVPMPIANQLPNARLAGEGLLRWFGFKIYQARLFVGDAYDGATITQHSVQGPSVPGPSVPGPLALELTYKRDFDGHSIAERSADEIDSLGFGSPAQRAQWTDQMDSLFPDIMEGDRLTGILTASGQTQFIHNERLLGQIDDPDFGQAFFSIWLDERTSAPALRAQLMGQTESAAGLYENAQ